MPFFWTFDSSKNPEKNCGFPQKFGDSTKILSSTNVFNIAKNLEHQFGQSKLFLKDQIKYMQSW